MKLRVKMEIVRALDRADLSDLVEQLEAELEELINLPLEATARFRVTKIENLLCETPKTDLTDP